MIERVYTFGSHGGLMGIVSEPDRSTERADAPGVIFSNVGLNHRVGPNRIYVELARRLAASGFRALRFDLSGFGDSEARRTTGSDLERATLDTREAMDFLEKKGVKRFVLIGFCSGVDSVHRVAVQDTRVVGAAFIDGYGYRNLGFWLRHLTVRNLRPARWRRYFRGRWARWTTTSNWSDTRETPEIFVLEYPTRQEFTADLARLVERSVKMLFIYTVVADSHYNYAGQLHDAFGYRDQIDVEYYTRADHVFSTEAHRDRLLSRLLRWMEASFPRESSALEHSASAVGRPHEHTARRSRFGMPSRGNSIA